MQQEWKLFGFVNTSRKEFRDIFRKYNRPAFSFSGNFKEDRFYLRFYLKKI